MAANALRINFLSLEDAETQSHPDVVLYVKKLVQTSRPNAREIELEEQNPDSAVVLSFYDTLDLLDDDEFRQVLFILSETREPIADCLLIRNELIGHYLNDPRYKRDTPLELMRTVMIAGKYKLKFTFGLRANLLKTKRLFRGHVLKNAQFNKPVTCAICHKFIWGIVLQGYQCSQCSFVTHLKCYLKIPFDCLQAPALPGSDPSPALTQDRPKVAHQFARYHAPFFQSIASGEENHCSHCGSLVLQNALKCIQCHCLIHEHCAPNVPPMCISSFEPPVVQRSLSLSPSPLPPSPLPPSSLPQFSDFACLGRLGTGRYGNVFCVQHRPSGKHLAIKVVNGSSEDARQQFALEKQVLLQYHHDNPYIIRGYFSFHCGSNLFLGMEFVDGDTLCDRIQRTRMNEEEVRFYFAELISVIQYLHNKRIIYRDLKLENIVINSRGDIRLIDYGLGRILAFPEERCFTICGTPAYLAPEIRLLDGSASNDGYSYSVDYWTLGMVFGQMLAGSHDEFYVQLSLNNHRQFDPQIITDAVARLPPHISAAARACLSSLLELDPDKRLGMPHSPYGQIRRHQFFAVRPPVNWEEIDDGVAKPLNNRFSVKSDTSTTTMLFENVSFDRSDYAKNEWMEAGAARCPASEEEQWRSFDFVNESAWPALE